MRYNFYTHDVVLGTKRFIITKDFQGTQDEERQQVHDFAAAHPVLQKLADPNHGFPRYKDFWTAEGMG